MHGMKHVPCAVDDDDDNSDIGYLLSDIYVHCYVAHGYKNVNDEKKQICIRLYGREEHMEDIEDKNKMYKMIHICSN